MTFKVGTRGAPLALVQARRVCNAPSRAPAQPLAETGGGSIEGDEPAPLRWVALDRPRSTLRRRFGR